MNADGKPIVADASSFEGFVADSQTPPLQQGEDGKMMLSPEAIKALDDEFVNKPQQQKANQSFPLLEEEWKMQEILRQWEETARQ